MFLTVGTQFPFDRLVAAVDRAIAENLVSEKVFGQIGQSGMRPRNLQWVHSLGTADFSARFRKSTAVISHAGIGTISMALAQNKPLLVMPRRERYGEHVNDHQLDTARAFSEMGQVLVAYEAEDVMKQLALLPRFRPKPRKSSVDLVVARVACYLDQLAGLR